MGELDFEAWIRHHEDELIGLLDDEAVEVVRAAGYHPTVFKPRPVTAFAGVGGSLKVLLISVDGRIVRIRSGG